MVTDDLNRIVFGKHGGDTISTRCCMRKKQMRIFVSVHNAVNYAKQNICGPWRVWQGEGHHIYGFSNKCFTDCFIPYHITAVHVPQPSRLYTSHCDTPVHCYPSTMAPDIRVVKHYDCTPKNISTKLSEKDEIELLSFTMKGVELKICPDYDAKGHMKQWRSEYINALQTLPYKDRKSWSGKPYRKYGPSQGKKELIDTFTFLFKYDNIGWKLRKYFKRGVMDMMTHPDSGTSVSLFLSTAFLALETKPEYIYLWSLICNGYLPYIDKSTNSWTHERIFHHN